MKLQTIVLVVLAVTLVASGVAAAMSSANFGLDWYVNMGTGGGGGPASSANYQANFTVGQNVAGASSSANYAAGTGYWSAFPFKTELYLPMVTKQ